MNCFCRKKSSTGCWYFQLKWKWNWNCWSTVRASSCKEWLSIHLSGEKTQLNEWETEKVINETNWKCFLRKVEKTQNYFQNFRLAFLDSNEEKAISKSIAIEIVLRTIDAHTVCVRLCARERMFWAQVAVCCWIHLNKFNPSGNCNLVQKVNNHQQLIIPGCIVK